MGSAGKQAESAATGFVKKATSSPEGFFESTLIAGDPSGTHILAELGGGREKVTKKFETFGKRTLGISSPDAPDVPNDPNILTEEEVGVAAKRKREFERIRRAGTKGRASTIRTGSRGVGTGVQTTFKQLGGGR